MKEGFSVLVIGVLIVISMPPLYAEQQHYFFPMIFNITSPADHQEIAGELKVKWQGAPSGRNVHIVVFREKGGEWPEVRRIKNVPWKKGEVKATPFGYFCRDTYAVRFMSGSDTVLGPVYFTAGAGACSGPSPIFVDLSQYQIDLDESPAAQLERDTCGAFAGIAALEAAYYRKYNQRIRLSQQYLHHIIKSTWLSEVCEYRYENQCSYWGGNDLHTVGKFLAVYPVPALHWAPYHSFATPGGYHCPVPPATNDCLKDHIGVNPGSITWNEDPADNGTSQEAIDLFEYNPANIPWAARSEARYGIAPKGYLPFPQALARRIPFLESLLRAKTEIIVAVDMYIEKNTGIAKTWAYKPVSAGGHMMLIVGFDKTDPETNYFLVKNSHGDGIVRVPYVVILVASKGAAIIINIRDPGHADAKSRWLGKWSLNHKTLKGDLFIRRIAEVNSNNQFPFVRVGDFVASRTGKRYCVTGLLGPQGDKLVLWINFSFERKVHGNAIATCPALLVHGRKLKFSMGAHGVPRRVRGEVYMDKHKEVIYLER
ncbi:MAG: hypothetical protein GY847_01175 [Proteobacteria bacterium]|nr:hypothetical protein [Pseudomonadota bacterium]